jgi:hypothetical protein
MRAICRRSEASDVDIGVPQRTRGALYPSGHLRCNARPRLADEPVEWYPPRRRVGRITFRDSADCGTQLDCAHWGFAMPTALHTDVGRSLRIVQQHPHQPHGDRVVPSHELGLQLRDTAGRGTADKILVRRPTTWIGSDEQRPHGG